MPHTPTSPQRASTTQERQQTLAAAYKVKQKLLNCSSFFKLSLKSQNRALAQEVTLLKKNNRLLQVQNTALLKEIQVHKFDLATSRGNERRLLDILNGLKAHADRATVLSSDLQAHVDMMIVRASLDNDTPDLPTNDVHRPTDSTVTDIPGPSSDSSSGPFLGPLRVKKKKNESILGNSALNTSPVANRCVESLPALNTSPVANRCEESPPVALVRLVEPPSTVAVENPSGATLLNAETEQTASSDCTETVVTVAKAVKKKTGSVKNKEKMQAGGKPVPLRAGKENKELTDPQGASGDHEAQKSEARRPAMQALNTSPVANRCEESTSLASARVGDPPCSMAVVKNPSGANALVNTEMTQQTASDRTETLVVKKKTGSAKNKEKTQVAEIAVQPKAGKENKTLPDLRGSTVDCDTETLEATQTKLVSTLPCDHVEEVRPPAMQQHHVASRIPKLKQRHACNSNSELKSSRTKESSDSKIPGDSFGRVDTQRLYSGDDENHAQERETDHDDDLQTSLSLTLPLSEPSRSPVKTLTTKRVKKMTPPADFPEPSSDNETAEQENTLCPPRVKKKKDAALGDLGNSLVSVPTELTGTNDGVTFGRSRRNRPKCRETFVVSEGVLAPLTSTNTDDGGVRERSTAEVHVPSRRNRLRGRETFVVSENNESETCEIPVVPELTNSTTASDLGGTSGESRRRKRPKCRGTFVVLETPLPLQTSTDLATDDAGEREMHAGEVCVLSTGNGSPGDRHTLNAPENDNESSVAHEDSVVVPAEASPERTLTSLSNVSTVTDHGVTVVPSRRNRSRWRETFVDLERVSTTTVACKPTGDERPAAEEVHVPSRRNVRPTGRQKFAVSDDSDVCEEQPAVISLDDSPGNGGACRNSGETSVVPDEWPAIETQEDPVVPDEALWERTLPPLTNVTTVTDHGLAVGHARSNKPRCRETFVVLATDNGGTVRRENEATCRDSVVPDECPAMETLEDPVVPDDATGNVATAGEEDNMASEEEMGFSRPRRRCNAPLTVVTRNQVR